MVSANPAILEFWRLFQLRAADLAAAESADTPVYDALLEALQAINPGLFLEFSVEQGAHELIVTAEGNRSLFPLVRTVVGSAPPIPGWSIRALKPKLGFPTTVRWQGFTLNTSDILFAPLERAGSSELGLRIFIPGIQPAETEDAHNAVLRAIDHGLGEEAFARSVQGTEVLPLPRHESTENLVRLQDLPSFIASRELKRREGAG